ncbi:MAG: hypothetical protein WC796_03985 [Candidatus Pacearchaeota archaeon]|jgi:hypothetical protein
MTNIRSTLKKALAGAAVVLTGLTTGISAADDITSPAKIEEVKPQRLFTGRVGTEYLGGNQTSLLTTTVGIAPKSFDPNDMWTRYFESARIIQTTGRENGTDVNCLEAGVQIPLKKVTGLNDKLTLFGVEKTTNGLTNSSEANGIGAEYFVNENDYTLILMGDKLDSKETKLVKKELVIPAKIAGDKKDHVFPYTERETTDNDSAHLGIYGDWKNDKLDIGGGFDTVRTSEGTTNHFLAKVRYLPTATDQLGLALRLSQEADDSTTKSIAANYGHVGEKEKWGTRIFARYDRNEERDTSNVEFHGILAQNPTLGKDIPFCWLTNNSTSDEGLYSENTVLPYALTLGRVPLTMRSKEGFVLGLDANLQNNQGTESGCIRAEIGYMFHPEKNTQIGISGFGKHDFTTSNTTNNASASKDTVGLNFYAHRNNLEAQLGISQGIGKDHNTSIYTGLQCVFGGPRK